MAKELVNDLERDRTDSARVSGERSPQARSTDFVVRRTLWVLLVLVGVAVALWILYRLKGILFLLVLSVFFSYLIAPIVRFVRRPVTLRGRHIVLPLPVAIGVVYLWIFGSLAGTLVLLLPVLNRQLGELAREAPTYIARAQDRGQTWQKRYQSHTLPAEARDAIDRAIRQTLTACQTYVTEQLVPRVAGWLTYVPWLSLVPILAFFMLRDAEVLRNAALRIFPWERLRSRGDMFLVEINDTLAAYIRAQLTSCLIIGVICTIGFVAIGTPYAIVLGIAAGLLEFIPLAGPLTIGVLVVIFASFHSAGQALAVVCFLVVLRVVQDYVVYPKLIGMGIHLPPMGVILAILCGAELAGLAGIFLAIPVVAILTVAFRNYRAHWAVPV
jgi:predicted PurR-regulated permease PerM